MLSIFKLLGYLVIIHKLKKTWRRGGGGGTLQLYRLMSRAKSKSGSVLGRRLRKITLKDYCHPTSVEDRGQLHSYSQFITGFLTYHRLLCRVIPSFSSMTNVVSVIICTLGLDPE